MIGFNFRMNEIEAGIGIIQLDKLNKIVEKKQKLANLLRKKLAGLKAYLCHMLGLVVLILIMYLP